MPSPFPGMDVSVCRIHQANRFYVYPIQLTDRLPVIGVPLLPGEADVPLDLQAVFDRCYDAGPYRREVRYNVEVPEPPLTPEQLAWVRKTVSPA